MKLVPLLRRFRHVRLPALGIALVIVGACTAQPVIQPSRDFDRPSDITFVCLGISDGAAAGGTTATGARIASGLPMRECHPRNAIDPSSANLRTFAFVPNSSSGDLTVLDADHWSLVNLDPANAGFNRLPLGVLPSQITSSDDGCRLVTANHGSCDLSVVDPAALLAPTLSRTVGTGAVTSTNATIVTNVVPVTKHSGRQLRLAAGEIAFLPQGTSTSSPPEPQTACAGDASHQWQALATFPSCDLVALIDLPSGIIQKAAYARKQGDSVVLVAVPDGEDPVCPVADCLYPPVAPADTSTNGDASDGGSDAAPTDVGGDAGPAVALTTPTNGLRPGPIAIIPESGRAYVGLANAPFVLAFNVSQDQLVVSSGGAIPLAEGAIGVNRLRLSIDPYKDVSIATAPGPNGEALNKAVPGAFVGDDATQDSSPDSKQAALDRHYLYAVARDGTLRVVQVAHTPEGECETNRDFSAITDETARTQAMSVACQPIGGASVRKPGVIGPGIRLPTPAIDIAMNDVRPGETDQSETTVSGTHAWVLTASGVVYLVNVDPVPRTISWIDSTTGPDGTLISVTPMACVKLDHSDCHPEPPPAPSTLRDRSFVGYSLALDPATGLPRLDSPSLQPSIGPRIESIWAVGSRANATALTTEFAQTQVYFPDPSTAVPQTWAITWEGNLMSGPRGTGQIKGDGKSLVDFGADFCRVGVKPDATNDLLTLQGCTNTNQCGIGQACIFGSNGALGAGSLPITGLCLDPALPPATCADLLSTIKRYDVTSAVKTELGLEPHKDELVKPTLQPCVVTSTTGGGGGDGGTTADGGTSSGDASTDGVAASLPQSTCVDPLDPSTASFQCLDGRCLYPCQVAGETSGCRAGRICVTFEPGAIPGQVFSASVKKAGTEPCLSNKCYCADGPDLTKTNTLQCLGELLPYQVSAGRSFLVSGSVSGIPATRFSDANGVCQPLPNLDPRVRVRIPMNAPTCTEVGTPADVDSLDSRCNPNLSDPQCASVPFVPVDPSVQPPPQTSQSKAQTIANKLTAIQQTPINTNPCLFLGGPNETDNPSERPHHIRALFRNREVEFMMTNLERPPSGAFQLRFDARGGFQAQAVAIPSTVEITMPTRLVLGPFDSNLQTGTPGTPTSEVPYMFVVDQRRLGRSQGGGPTRGQLLRIHPRGFEVTTPATGFQPWFEDLAHSADLFPIQ